MMSFYKQQHKFYSGVDLHTKQMYCSIVESEGKTHNPELGEFLRSGRTVTIREGDQKPFDLAKSSNAPSLLT